MVGTLIGRTLVASLYLSSNVSARPSDKRQITLTLNKVQEQALANAYKVLDGTLSDGLTTRPATCNKNTVSVQEELGDMTRDERKEYTRPVNYILKKPSKL